MWISNGEIADVAIIWAHSEDGIRGFLLEKQTPGFEAHPVRRRYSQRASVTSVLNLKNVSVPVENVLPGTKGLKSALMCLNEARYGIAWRAVDAAMTCYAQPVRYVPVPTAMSRSWSL